MTTANLNLVFPSSRGTVQNQSNIMSRYFWLIQIETGIYVEVVKLEKETKKTVRKSAKYGLHLFATSAPLCGSKRTTARNGYKRRWAKHRSCRLTTPTDISSISETTTRKL